MGKRSGRDQPYRQPAVEAAYSDEIVTPGGVRFVVSEWDVEEARVQALVAAGVPWAVRRCPPRRAGDDGGDDMLWPQLLAADERSELARDAISPWTDTPSKAGTKKLRRRAWQASVWTSGSAQLLVLEEA